MKTETTLRSVSSTFSSLHGIWLLLARSVWLALVVGALGLFASGLSVRAKNLHEQYQPKIGISLISDRFGNILVFPWPNYPANQAGVLDGDVLVGVNGKPPHLEPGGSLDELLPEGAIGTSVALTVRTGDHPPRTYQLFFGGQDPAALARLGFSVPFMATYAIAVEIIFALICLGIAAAIFLRKSNDGMALLASLTFILVLLDLSEQAFAFYADQPVWRPALDLWFALILLDLVLFLCIFPDGRFVPRWTQILIVIGALWILVQWLDPRLYPWKMTFEMGFSIIVAWLAIGVVAQVYRYRYQSSPIQRQQTKWVLVGMVVSTLGLLGLAYDIELPGVAVPSGAPSVFFNLIGYPAIQLFKLSLPLTIAIAILRYRLWDIDILINRTLVYGGLTASVIAIYVILVGVLGTTIQGRGSLILSVLATGLIAVLVQPLRDRLQRGVNRLMYGERDDPVTVLSRLGQRLEATLAPDAVLPSLAETVAQALKLPYVAIETQTDRRLDSPSTIDSPSPNTSSSSVAYGHPQPEIIRLPLIYQSEIIGQLLVSPRAPGEPLSPMDRHLLENIAHQAGLAVHAVNLTADLRLSRQRLVTAREEERRRLRRDLHDGLGPNLASQGLKLAAAKHLLEQDPASAGPLLDQVIAQNHSTVEDVRRLVYGLRPPALDEFGLIAAIRDYAAGMEGKSMLQIQVVEPPRGLPPSSAAVEVAAYRIVLEALTNVIRHAHAQHCSIRFSLDHNGTEPMLQIEIQDDGIGLPSAGRSGIGTRSMRERAEEVGGTCTMDAVASGGTRVCVRIPLIVA